ncbi:MAG: YdcF family protein [Clostridiales Family XIII bacterium]|jgi:vancomycin permeability regulator SanA|nr:YdcF family protein [Clostridiales Family XIII bacterium]
MLFKRTSADEPNKKTLFKRKHDKKHDGNKHDKAAGRGDLSLRRKVVRVLVRVTVAAVFLCALVVAVTNIVVISTAKDLIITEGEAAALGAGADRPDCIEALGAAVYRGKPSIMLRDRIDTSLELYRDGAADVLLFSGDNGRQEYNEVEAMRQYAIENGEPYGVTEDHIYLDYAGFSTYESMYRLKAVFGVDKAIVVTQEYHLYRALYTAKRLGIEVHGVAAAPRKTHQFERDVREVLARTKDFFFVLFDVQPTYLGEPVSLTVPVSIAEN